MARTSLEAAGRRGRAGFRSGSIIAFAHLYRKLNKPNKLLLPGINTRGEGIAESKDVAVLCASACQDFSLSRLAVSMPCTGRLDYGFGLLPNCFGGSSTSVRPRGGFGQEVGAAASTLPSRTLMRLRLHSG